MSQTTELSHCVCVCVFVCEAGFRNVGQIEAEMFYLLLKESFQKDGEMLQNKEVNLKVQMNCKTFKQAQGTSPPQLFVS